MLGVRQIKLENFIFEITIPIDKKTFIKIFWIKPIVNFDITELNIPKNILKYPNTIIGKMRKETNIFDIKKVNEILLKLYRIIGNIIICTLIL